MEWVEGGKREGETNASERAFSGKLSPLRHRDPVKREERTEKGKETAVEARGSGSVESCVSGRKLVAMSPFTLSFYLHY